MPCVFPSPSFTGVYGLNSSGHLSLGIPVKQRLALWMPENRQGFAESGVFNRFGGCDGVPLVFLGHGG